jgi:hypothetical protein
MSMAENLQRVVVTSFSQQGFESYGQRMISSFREHWPQDIKLIVVSEHPLPLESDDQVIFQDYDEIAPEGVQFKKKFGQFREANGRFVKFKSDGGDTEVVTAYRFSLDAIRFSHKVFSIFGVSRRYDCDELFWIDGDTSTHTQIDEAFFSAVSPGDGHISYLGRDHMYSECGFLIFNRRNRVHDAVLTEMANIYMSGDVFLLPEWHDCMVLDVVRDHYSKAEGTENKNLSGAGASEDDPWKHSALASYMEHMKGPDKKESCILPMALEQ